MAKAEEQGNIASLNLAKLARQERIIAICRAILPSFVLLAAFAVFGSFLQRFDSLTPIFRAFFAILVLIVWFIAFVVAYHRLQSRTKLSARQFASAIEKQIGFEELAPLSTSGENQISGDKAVWELAQQKILNAKYRGGGFVKLKKSDWVWLLVFSILIGFAAINPKPTIGTLAPNIWAILGKPEPQISGHIEAPSWLNLPNLDLPSSAADAKSEIIDAARGSIIELRLSGTKSAPKVSFGAYKQSMWKDENNSWRIRIKIIKSGTLKLHAFGTGAKYKIRIRPDRAPILNGEVKIEPDSKGLIIGFNAHDEYRLKSAHLSIYGQTGKGFNSAKLTDVFILDPDLINFDAPLRIGVDSSKSALAGLDVRAVLVLEDMYGQKTYSKVSKARLPQPYFSTQIAKAIQEVRLLLLRESAPFRAIEQNYLYMNDPISGGLIKVVAPNPILSAPKNIARSHMILSALVSSRAQLPVSDNARIGLSHALRRLEYSQNLLAAKEVAEILWSIINDIEQNSRDGKTKIAEAINNLKAAMQNGADSGQMAMLQDELKAAISEHLDSLRNQSGEAGDMEVEDSEIIGEIDINKSLSDAQESAQKGDNQSAEQKLDELEEMLSNLGPNGERSSAKGVSIKGLNETPPNETSPNENLANEQQDLANETANANSQQSNKELQAEQEKLLSKLPKPETIETPEDANISEARAHMETAIEELKAGNRKSAHNAQLSSIEALHHATQGPQANDNNTDPLGRKIGEGRAQSSGANANQSNSVPLESEPLRARNILEKLRQRLSRPNDNQEEKDYIENAIGRE